MRLAGDARLGALATHHRPLLDAVLDGEARTLSSARGRALDARRRYGIVVEQLSPLALQLAPLAILHGRGMPLDVKTSNIIRARPKCRTQHRLAFEDAWRPVAIGTDANWREQCEQHRFGQIGPSTTGGRGGRCRGARRRAPLPDGVSTAESLRALPAAGFDAEPLGENVRAAPRDRARRTRGRHAARPLPARAPRAGAAVALLPPSAPRPLPARLAAAKPPAPAPMRTVSSCLAV